VTIRGGRNPRDQARPMEPGSYEGADMPEWRASDGRGNPPPGRRAPGRREGGGLPGILRFILFAGILAAVVVIAGLTALRPLVRAAVVGWAWDNPGSLRYPLVADFIREDLGDALKQPAGGNADDVVFEVHEGDTIAGLAPRLRDAGFIESDRAFIFTATEENLAARLQAGLFILRRNMTPAQVVTALVDARVVITSVDVTFREGLRLEQMTAQLQNVDSGVNAKAFYDLAKKPTATLLADYPWLKLPKGASLEGFLYPAKYTLITATNGGPFEITTAEGLVRMMLTKFHDAVGDDRLKVAESRGLSFYQILTLASIVEREAVVDEERPLIAGVYQNRLDGKGGLKTILNADPTVLYAVDTLKLADLDFAQWRNYFFWSVPEGGLQGINVGADLAGYQTYTHRGLPPGPICTPTVASIDAALEPDTSAGYLFFLAIPDGGGTHAFAKTEAEHNANKIKYGYN
jgi:UPF0755 protein